MLEYETIRKHLQTRYDEIQTRLQKIRQNVQHKEEPLPSDFAEQAIERENDEVLDALDHSIRNEMTQIQVTLQQLAAGDYGICESCEKKIPLKRLAALPHTSHCVACAENVEPLP